MAVQMIEIYRHSVDGETDYYTDSPNPYSEDARQFKPWVDEDSIWYEVGDESRTPWAYIAAYGCMVPWSERDNL